MNLGKSPSKSKSSSKSNKNVSNLMNVSEDVSEDVSELKAYVVMGKNPQYIGSDRASCMEISSKTLPSQAGRFGAVIEDIFNVNFRSETSAKAAEAWYRDQPHIKKGSFFANRDFFTGLTIPNSLTKQLQSLCHALQIQYNHTLPYNTAAMYGLSLNTHNIDRYFEGVIGVMPTFKYGNISFGDFDFVILKPRFFIPPNHWNICSIPLGPRTKMKEDRKDSNLYRLSDFLPLFSNRDATTMKRGLLEKIERARELQIEKIQEQIDKLSSDNKKNKNDARIKEISDIIRLWEADIERFDADEIATEILQDENVGELRKAMCKITLDRIEPLLVDNPNNKSRFSALKKSVAEMDNNTTSNTKIGITYVDSDGKTETEQVEIKDVDIEITQPSSLTSLAIVCNEVSLVGPNSRFYEAISAVYGDRPSQFTHHLYPGDSHIGKPLKPHKPVLIEIDYKDIDEKHLLDALVHEIEGKSISKKERLRESFFLKLLENGFVYKVEDNGDKLKVQDIPRASAIALGDIALASRSLSALDPTDGYENWSNRHPGERRSSSSMVQSSSPSDKEVLEYLEFQKQSASVQEQRPRANAIVDISPPVKRRTKFFNKPQKNMVPNFWRPQLINSDPIKTETYIYSQMREDISKPKNKGIDYQFPQATINNVKNKKRPKRWGNKSNKRYKSRSPDSMGGGKRKTRKNRR